MVRRQLLVVVSALAMILFGAGIVGGLVAATQSEGGREWIRAQVTRELNRGLQGRLFIGRLSGSFLTDLTIDSLELRDADDSVYVALGRLTVRYDPRDLVDGRFIFRHIDAAGARFILRKDFDESWNYRKVFPQRPRQTAVVRRARGAFGSLVILQDVRLRGGEVRLTKPWTPDDTLTGARRDSAIVANIADTTEEIRRVPGGGPARYRKTWRWRAIDAEFARVRLRHPDSTGRSFAITRMDLDETVPPFNIRGLTGHAQWRGDTIWLDATRFALGHSTGSARGSVEWPTSDMYWDMRIQSDSTSLRDLWWISPSIPRDGVGRMDLRILTRREDHHLTDYVITNMDVRSRASRLRGNMTWRVGGPVLEVLDVDLALDPADFVFFEALNTEPFPYPWKGRVTGRILASGGPVNAFRVEMADLAFADDNVPGATARGVGRGELDILFPAFTKFHGFTLDLDHFDLRTGQFLNPLFPRLNGLVSGTAVLDSVWLDVRVRDADLTHRDGDAPPSRFTGEARVTLGDEYVTFDASMAALPISATALSRSYPLFPLRGDYRGPIRAQGTVADFVLSADVVGDAGRVQVDGRFDAFEPGFGAVARGVVTALDFRRAFGTSALPGSVFDGRFAVDLRGDSLSNLTGSAVFDADRSLVDSVRVFDGRAAMTFADGRLAVDSARFDSAIGMLRARGALGLVPSVTDTLRFVATADSLGGLRRYLARGGATTDSLQGALRATGVLTGQASRFALDATVEGSGLLVRTTTMRQFRGTVALSALPDSATGAMTIRLDGVRSGSLVLDEADVRADLLGGWQARAVANLAAPSGVTVRALADLRRAGDTLTVRLDSLRARTSANVWTLRQPATVATAGSAFRLDTLVLAGSTGGELIATGRRTAGDTLAVAVRAEAIPLADVGELLQSREPMRGQANLRADLRGTRDRPDLFFSGSLTDASIGGMPMGRIDADGRYAERRLTSTLSLARDGVLAMHAEASVPIDLSLEPRGSRFPEEPITGRVRTDSAGLGLLETFIPGVREAQGALRMDVDVSGTWRHPRLTGSLTVTGGSLQIDPMGQVRLEGVEANIGFLGDSIAIRQLSARSGPDRARTATVSGGVSIRDAENPAMSLRLDAQRFNVLNDPRVADIDLSGSLVLAGRRRAATLTGGFTVDRGEIRLPELYQKRLISLDDPDLYRIVDTTALMERRAITAGDSVFMNNLGVRNVQIRMGPDVWLRSDEANIALGGFVSVTRNRVLTGPNAGRWQLALEGPLQTVRGTYRLNLGPVIRTFTVESGEVRFYGDPDLNPTLNINALHVVRQVSQQGARPDVRVRVRIGGTRLSPTAELSSPDSVRVTTADLVSYLTTGGPSNEISGRGTDYATTAARFALASVGSFLGGKVSGGVCDDAQVSTAGLDAYQGRLLSVGGRILQGTRFNCARQLSDRLFVRLDAGLCQVGKLVDGGSGAPSQTALADAFGVKLDYRVADDLTVSAGVEPPTSAVFCRDDAGARGFAPTPRQIGVDLFRLWRF